MAYCISCESILERKQYYQNRLNHLPDNRQSFEKNIGNPHLEGLVSNPLLLSQAILIHSIDDKFEIDNVEKLYAKFVTTLLYQWDEVRQMDFFPELLGSRNVENMYKLLRRLAFRFSELGVTKLKVKDFLPDMVRAIERFKNSLPQPDKIMDLSLELLRVFRDRSGILTGSTIDEDFLETEFEFQHKSIQDYLTAVTIAEDALLQNKSFSLYDKVGNTFWDRTIEFYVNLGNPDFFFEDYIQRIKIGGKANAFLNYFAQYFFLAKEKGSDLEAKLSKKVHILFRYSNNVIEIQIALAILNRLPETNIPIEYLQYLITNPELEDEAYRQVKIAQLYFLKHQYSNIRPILKNKIELFLKEPISKSLFTFIVHICPITLLENDYFFLVKILKPININIYHEINNIESTKPNNNLLIFFIQYFYLIDIHDILKLDRLANITNIQNLRNIQKMLRIQHLLDISDMQSMQYMRYMLDIVYLQSYLIDMRNLRNIQYMQYTRDESLLTFYQINKDNKDKIYEEIKSHYEVFTSLAENEKNKIFRYIE